MSYKELAQKIKEMETMHDRQFTDIYQALKILLEEKERRENVENRERIGFRTAEKAGK